MPTEFNYTDHLTTIQCSHCRSSVAVNGRIGSAGDDQTINGAPVADFIRWLPARGVYHSWCRTCERAARRAAPNRAARRNVAPGSRNLTRKFGVELELIFPSGVTRARVEAALTEAGLTGWRAKHDGSLSGGNGIEVVTPPLSGDAGLESLRTGMRVLARLGAKPNRTCGTHVHHDAADMDVDSIKRFVKAWAANQRSVIDGLLAPSRRSTAAPYYCGPLGSSLLRRVAEATTLDEFRGGRITQGHRYSAVNLCSYGRYGTIEIRQHQGTIDFEKVRSWIMLGQAMMDASRTAPLPAAATVRTFLQGLGTMLDETARTFLLGRAVVFGHATV